MEKKDIATFICGIILVASIFLGTCGAVWFSQKIGIEKLGDEYILYENQIYEKRDIESVGEILENR